MLGFALISDRTRTAPTRAHSTKMPALFFLLALPSTSALRALAFLPGGVQPAMHSLPLQLKMQLGRGSVPKVSFASAYKPSEIAALWTAVKKCYGSETAALDAISQNEQVLCPIYATPSLITESYLSLVKLVGVRTCAAFAMRTHVMIVSNRGSPGARRRKRPSTSCV